MPRPNRRGSRSDPQQDRQHTLAPSGGQTVGNDRPSAPNCFIRDARVHPRASLFLHRLTGDSFLPRAPRFPFRSLPSRATSALTSEGHRSATHTNVPRKFFKVPLAVWSMVGYREPNRCGWGPTVDPRIAKAWIGRSRCTEASLEHGPQARSRRRFLSGFRTRRSLSPLIPIAARPLVRIPPASPGPLERGDP